MSIFSVLPTVNSCCFCIDLKWGSILIAIYTIFSFATSSFTVYYSPCGEKDRIYELILNIVAFVLFFVNLLLFIAGIVFIIGIIKSMPNTATWFMYGMVLSIITSLVYSVLFVIISFIDPKCQYYADMFIPTICVLIWVYFMIVVKSYQERM